MANGATELARLHSAARPLREQFAAALIERQGEVPVAPSLAWAELTDAANALHDRCTCPDDAVLLDGCYRLVDFEGAQWRHVIWDVAYLRVPWPTCWCSWRLPEDVAERAVDAYRGAAAPTFPSSPTTASSRTSTQPAWAGR